MISKENVERLKKEFPRVWASLVNGIKGHDHTDCEKELMDHYFIGFDPAGGVYMESPDNHVPPMKWVDCTDEELRLGEGGWIEGGNL